MPKIYISSTIYDFRDLRSALKYSLEQLGYEVLLSEFNDFIKPLDENSYTACLRAVEQSDYFILLVGTRVGGLYDKSGKVSITRGEYRKAYELVKLGKMKIITFVRADLWSIREDRKALEEYLKEDFRKRKDLDEEDILSISRHSSTIVNDAEATFDFLNEVGRVNEMKQAIAGKEVFPIGNWIHPFDSFHEIIETLQEVFEMSRSLNTVALITNLKRELLSNLAELTSKDKEGTVHLDASFADFARKNFKGNLMDTTISPSKYVKWLVIYLITVIHSNKDKISTQFVDQALTTGHFLEYDFKTNTYEIGSLHNALFLLKENINPKNRSYPRLKAEQP